MGKTLFLQLFLRCQAYDKKIRWTFFSYASKEAKSVFRW